MPLEFELCPGRVVGGDHPCFVIAEIGQNHQGDIEIAKKMIKMAKVTRGAPPGLTRCESCVRRATNKHLYCHVVTFFFGGWGQCSCSHHDKHTAFEDVITSSGPFIPKTTNYTPCIKEFGE